MTATDARVARIMLLEAIIDSDFIAEQALYNIIGDDRRGAVRWLDQRGLITAEWSGRRCGIPGYRYTGPRR